MIKRFKDKYVSWIVSLGIHLIVFIWMSLTGLFDEFSYHKENPVDVVLYEAREDEFIDSASTGESNDTALNKTQNNKENLVTKEGSAQIENSHSQNTFTSNNLVTESAAQDTEIGAGKNIETKNDIVGQSNIAGNEGNLSQEFVKGEALQRDEVAAQKPATPPSLESRQSPLYPENLRKEGIEGSVSLRIIVAADGSVENVSVSSSSGYAEMDSAAINAAYGYTFIPATNIYGEYVRCATNQTIRFVLQ